MPEFEEACWGKVTGDQAEHHAKAVALGFDTRDLENVELPWRVQCGERNRGWYFGLAQQGSLQIGVAPLPSLNKVHANLLRVALRIQIRRATFGAKDQFGLGVLGVLDAEALPAAEPLVNIEAPLSYTPGLHNAFFVRVLFDCPAPSAWHARLKAGLCCRGALRNALRDPADPHDRLRGLRHYVMGWFDPRPGGSAQRCAGEYGSAVNVSAVYPTDDKHCEIRVWGVFPHTRPPQFAHERGTVMRKLGAALAVSAPSLLNECHGSRVLWCDAGNGNADLGTLLNKLAGLPT